MEDLSISGDFAYSEYCEEYYLMFSPNPTSGETTLSIESGPAQENNELKSATISSSFDENTEWDLEIYDPSQKLKQQKSSVKGNCTTLQTHGWKDGVYVVRVNYKNKILSAKLVVNQ